MSDVIFNDKSPIAAGWIATAQKALAADTYYKGMVLEYDATANNYKAITTGGDPRAIYNGVDGYELTGAGNADVIIGGVIYEGALVDADGTKLSITEALRVEASGFGFFLVK